MSEYIDLGVLDTRTLMALSATLEREIALVSDDPDNGLWVLNETVGSILFERGAHEDRA